jgi:hypothetical protein
VDLGGVAVDGQDRILLATTDRPRVGPNGGNDFTVSRLKFDGSLDPSFGTGGEQTVLFTPTYQSAEVRGIALDPAGGIIVVGNVDDPGVPFHGVAVARFEGYDYSVVGTAGNDTISIDAGTVAGTLKVTVDGNTQDNVAVTGQVFVAGLGGVDTINVTAALAGGLILSGGGGSDSFRVNFGNLAGPVQIIGDPSATNSLTVNGDSSATNVINKTPGQITWGSPVTESIAFRGVSNTTINANGTSQNTINDPGGNTVINGGPGANTITITATTGAGVVIHGGPTTNTYVIDLGSLAAPVTVANSNASASDSLVVNGAPGDNTIRAAGTQVTAGTQTVNVSAPLTNLTLNGGSGNNQVTVSALTVPVQNLALNGGGTSTAITLNNVGSSVGSLAITGGSSTPGSTVVQVQGSLPATVTAQQVPPLVSGGPNATVDTWMPYFGTGSFRDPAAAGAYTATANYGDGTGTQPLVLGANNSFSLSHAFAAPGVYTVTATVSDQYGSGSTTFTITVRPRAIYVLDASASGALAVSGNASLAIPGRLMVDSSSSTALTAGGNAQVQAGSIQVVGGASKSGNAVFNVTPSTGTASFADPLASLVGPSTAKLTSFGAASYSSGSHPLSPGIYSQISASGNASLVLSAGQYIIEGGGLTVTGNASVRGSGVMIYNTGSNYPSAGGNYGGITLSGNGTFSLTAATGGAYPGILIYQSRSDTRALSLSGSGTAGLNGTIYAPTAQMTMSGNAQLSGALVVDRLNLSGNVALSQTADGSGSSSDTAGIAGTLLAGNLTVYVNDPSGSLTPDERARISDAIHAWDSVLAPYSVTITQVSDPALANIVVDDSTTSASGSAANGVLGCYNTATSEITLLQGWNWYAGTDPTRIGAGQYDLETTVLHELGHALGLGHSPDPRSPMHGTLAAGVADRTPTTQDLNIPDPPAGADPLMAAGFRLDPAASALASGNFTATANAGSSQSPAGLMPVSATGVAATATTVSTAFPARQPASATAQPAVRSVMDSGPSRVAQGTDQEVEDRLLPAKSRAGLPFDSVLDQLGADSSQGLVVGRRRISPVLDSALDALASDPILVHGQEDGGTIRDLARATAGGVRSTVRVLIDPTPQDNDPFCDAGSAPAGLSHVAMAVGFAGFGAGLLAARNRRARSLSLRKRSLTFGPRAQ